MKGLYVGKGLIQKRLIAHFQKKDFAEEKIVYYTFIVCENRIAKYCEQLFLDIYDMPYNKSENIGNIKLCSHWTQYEVD